MGTSELIFYAGWVLMGLAVLGALITTPILIFAGVRLRKQLGIEYGVKNVSSDRERKR